jgi:aspartate aminotransferase
MANRLLWARKTLHEELLRLRTPGNWDFIIRQIGMFTFTGLTRKAYLFIFFLFTYLCSLFSRATSDRVNSKVSYLSITKWKNKVCHSEGYNFFNSLIS